MRKSIIGLALAFLLVATFCYADSGAREPAYNLENKTNFSTVGLTGCKDAGCPGYLELRGANNFDADTRVTWYLWVDRVGQLIISSHASIGSLASFPTGDWSTGLSGTVVGDQTGTVNDM